MLEKKPQQKYQEKLSETLAQRQNKAYYRILQRSNNYGKNMLEVTVPRILKIFVYRMKIPNKNIRNKIN